MLQRLRRRLADGEPLSARKVADHVDESCEFLAELLAFCRSEEVLKQVLQAVESDEMAEEEPRRSIHGHYVRGLRAFGGSSYGGA